MWIAHAKLFFEGFHCLIRNKLTNIFKTGDHVEQDRDKEK